MHQKINRDAAQQLHDASKFKEMADKSKRMAQRNNLAKAGERVIVMVGVPFGTPAITRGSALARLEAAVGLVDHIGPSATTDHAVIPVTIFERLK